MCGFSVLTGGSAFAPRHIAPSSRAVQETIREACGYTRAGTLARRSASRLAVARALRDLPDLCAAACTAVQGFISRRLPRGVSARVRFGPLLACVGAAIIDCAVSRTLFHRSHPG